jgi:hypothetical protein
MEAAGTFCWTEQRKFLKREGTVIKHRLGRSIRAVSPLDGSDQISHDPAKECFGFQGSCLSGKHTWDDEERREKGREGLGAEG